MLVYDGPDGNILRSQAFQSLQGCMALRWPRGNRATGIVIAGLVHRSHVEGRRAGLESNAGRARIGVCIQVAGLGDSAR